MMRALNSVSFSCSQFSVLTDDQLDQLHNGALEVLRRTGVRFFHRKSLDLLKRAGAWISDGNLVKFPAFMVERALTSVPGRIVMCDREGEPAMFLEGTRSYFGTGSDCLNLIDPATGAHRRFFQEDLKRGYRLCDALSNIHFVMSIGIPIDVDSDLVYDVQMALMLEHTTKPIVFVTDDGDSCRRAIDMAAAVAGGREALQEQQHILLYSEPSSPLQQSETALDKLLLMAESQLPIVHSPAPLMGGTGPITMASGLVMALAEILSSIVIHQLCRPGAPFIFGSGLHHMDMRAAQICYGSPEFQLTKTAIAQLGRRYGIPTWGYAGCTDSKLLDEQAAIENLLSVMMARFSGANLVHDVGYLESGLCCSFEMIVLTDELVTLTDNLVKGIEINDETIMLDEIHDVGPGGHFMSTEQTLNRFRDFWYPDLIDRRRRGEWLADGGSTLGNRLNARVREIIAEHRPKPLSPVQRECMKDVLEASG